eukprot:scaffold5283_cov74-Phaeocystis_antarctica.AAC.1
MRTRSRYTLAAVLSPHAVAASASEFGSSLRLRRPHDLEVRSGTDDGARAAAPVAVRGGAGGGAVF